MGERLHTYKAGTLDEAYRCMRAELGEDAVVLSTHEETEGGVLGLLGRKVVKLTAQATRQPAPETAVRRRPSAVERKYAQHGVPAKPPVSDTCAYFQRVIEEAKERMRAGATAPAPDGRAPASVVPFPPRGHAQNPVADAGHPVEEMRRGVQEMSDMLRVLVAETSSTGPFREFADHYRALVDHGVARKIAAALINGVVQGTDESYLRDRRVFRERLRIEVQKRVGVTGGITLTPGIRRTVALVGATGVGKTTNLAKLAAEFAIRQRVRVALVTSDTYRIAAPEQLRVYANILGLPMTVVNSPQEMGRAMQQFRDYDLILVDTAGGSQFNTDQLEELEAILAPARPDEVLLLLSANTQVHELLTIVERFRRLSPTSLFFTKLDETRHYGSLFTVCADGGLPLSYFSVGQDVPNDIELASPGKVADWVVEELGSRDRSSSKSA